MARRKPSQGKTALPIETPDTGTPDEQTAQPEAGNAPETVAPEQALPDPYQVLLERGEAAKMSPKSEGKIYFQIARSEEDKRVYLRIHSQDGGGLHSKEWVPAQAIIEALKPHAGQSIKSGILKPLFKSGSANNASFMAAILRAPEVGLLEPDPQRQFQHLLAGDFVAKAEALLQR